MSDQRSVAEPNIMISNSVLTGGTYTMVQTFKQGTPRDPLKILQDASSPSAFHNAGERYDPPKCHENTRVAVLQKIMNWIIGCDPETRDKWIMWLSGGAGAGKSAISQTLAERCDVEGRLLASFFFGRSDGTRNHAKSLIPTITCQIYANIPGTRNDILSVINDDPLIFNKTLLIQLMSLIVAPLDRLGDAVSQHLIIIDGLDECVDRTSQVTILRTLFDAFQKHRCRIRFLVASRPEYDIINTFSLKNVDIILARLVLNDEYLPGNDIELFLNDKIKETAETHPFRNLIPEDWPGDYVVREIARKSSGQFVYASTVVKYIQSTRHRPDHRLEIVRNLRPRKGDSDMPFAELDALYTHILSSTENPSLVMEILSFIIHETRIDISISSHRTLSPIKDIEEIHDLEPGSLPILLCDIGSLVAVEINPTKLDSIKVLHASILDFFIEPSRSKNLHIPVNLLITKHFTNCLQFLSKNTDSDTTQTVVRFLINYCARVSFTEDMANAFDGFSLLKLYQHNSNTIRLSTKYSFLLRLNPTLLELIRRSDQNQFLSRYLTMLDESYIALLDKYPPESLALHLCIIMHENVFPPPATKEDFRLPPFRAEDDTLWFMPQIYYQLKNTGSGAGQACEEHRAALRQFLLDPVRSKHYTFQSSAGKIYAKSLLGCFNYLDTQLFRYHYCSHCSTDRLLRLIPFTMEERKEDLNAAFDDKNFEDALTSDRWEEDRTTKDAWDQYFSHNPEDADIVDTSKDIQAWYENWHQVVVCKENEDWRDFPLSYPMRYSPWGPEPDSLRKLWQGRYGLMLGYMIYFPRAGKSQRLIELCKTTVLRRDLTLFPEDTVRAQRAMEAYVKRVEAIKDDDE